MDDKLLVGQGHQILETSETSWKQQLAQVPQNSQARLGFMTEAHHRLRYFAVRELVNGQRPVAPTFIAEMLHLPLEQVEAILEELEKRLFFLVRNEQHAVLRRTPSPWTLHLTA